MGGLMGKGSAYERIICKRLSLWWTKGERDDVFWRSQSSGARATIRSKKGLRTANQQGDVQAMDVSGQALIDKVCIELKRGYADFGVDELISGKKREPVICRFIAQCQREVKDDLRFWWLIVKQDRRKDVICFPVSFLALIRGRCELKDTLRVHVVLDDKIRFAIMRLDDFFEIVTPDVLCS
jgi:hypothetical protein